MIEITCATATGTHTRGMRAGAKIVSRASRATRGVVPFSRPYPPSRQSGPGIGYKAGKSDTPLVAEIPILLPVFLRKFRRSARSLPVVVGLNINGPVGRARPWHKVRRA